VPRRRCPPGCGRVLCEDAGPDKASGAFSPIRPLPAPGDRLSDRAPHPAAMAGNNTRATRSQDNGMADSRPASAQPRQPFFFGLRMVKRALPSPVPMVRMPQRL
jgi:hypothetical protein